MPGETRDLRVRWLGDATSLVKSSTTAERAVASSGKKIEGAGASMGGSFGKVGKVLGAFGLPFGGAAKTMQGEMGTLESSGVSMGGAMGGPVTAGIAIAAGAAVAFAKSSVDAAEQFQHAHEQLATVVTNTGQSIEVEGGKIKTADDRMVSLGFTTADTETSLARLVPVTHNVGAATQLLGTAADLARARNMTLGDATQMLVAIEAGRLKGLAKLGIATKDASGKTLTAQQAVQKITDLFHGAASQYADTYAGKLDVLKSTVNQLKVSVGNELLPALSDFATIGVGAARGLESLDVGLHHVGISIGSIASTLVTSALPGGIGSLVQGFLGMKHKGDAATATLKSLQTAQKNYADDLAAGDKTSAKAIADRQAYTDAQAKANVVTTGLTDATAAQTTATAAAAKAAKAAAAEQQKETDAILGTRDANIALSNATLGVSDSIDTYTAKAKAAADAGGKNAQANRDWEKAANDVKSQIDGVASSAQNAAQQEATLHGKTLDARDSAAAQRDALEKLRSTIAPGNPFRAYLDGLIRDLDRAATPRTEQFHLSITPLGPGGKPVVVHGGVNLPGTSFVFGEGGYVPGPIGAPVPAIVHGGEYVTRAKDVGRAGASISNHYSITVQVSPGADPAATGKAVVDAIRAYEKRNGSSWRAA